MPTCKTNFTETDNDLAYKLNQSLSKAGVSCKAMDQGVSVINYDGKSCPTESMKSCVVGAHDGQVEASEVFEFAFDHYGKYQKIIEGAVGQNLPWVLDDHNPKTFFDAKIRKKAQGALVRLKGILKSNGVHVGTEEYKEKLAVGLFFLAELPDKDFIRNNKARFKARFEKDSKELVDLGLVKFKQYLEKNGGLRVAESDASELTALEALDKNQGDCTEGSKILFALHKMAGLRPVFVHIQHEGIKSSDAVTQEYITHLPQNVDHMCIGLEVAGKFRLFDTALLNSNALHDKIQAFTLRQSFSYFLVNTGVVWARDGYFDWAIDDYNQALKIDPQLAMAYYNRGIAWFKKGDTDRAIADYNEALKMNPHLVLARYNLGLAWMSKCQTQITDLVDSFLANLG